jgi:hypothetical protein
MRFLSSLASIIASFCIRPSLQFTINTPGGTSWGPLRIPPDIDSLAEGAQAVRVPLKYIGPYPCLALRFPNLQTANQRARDVSGVSLDFVLDTAANVNTINAQVANELQLHVVGQALPGVGAAGAMQGGATYELGDAQLEGLADEPFTFMSNLTASSLPIASPAAAGLLSISFLQCFEGGVEFSWGAKGSEEPPAVTFFGERLDTHDGRARVPIDRIPITQLLSVKVVINGVEMPALLDTGSPITVLNAQAAVLAGIETVLDPAKSSQNPFGAFVNQFQPSKSASRGDVLTIMGVGGKPVSLLNSKQTVKIDLLGEDDLVDFGTGNVYVGDLPGLAALQGLGVESPPAVVLGMDVLKRRKSMLLRAQDNLVLFE